MESFVSLVRNHHVNKLDFCGNRIGVGGFEVLASFLQDPSCNLVTLNLNNVPIDDDCSAILAHALRANTKLDSVLFKNTTATTRAGWKSFSKALCDTSTINKTYHSNHTLKNFGSQLPPSRRLNRSLMLNNNGTSTKQVAIRKILRNHRRLEMGSLFEWELNMLPYVVNWFGRARVISGIDTSIDKRKLDAIYQFIHAMPETLEKPHSTKQKVVRSDTKLSIWQVGCFLLFSGYALSAIKKA